MAKLSITFLGNPVRVVNKFIRDADTTKVA